MIFLSKCNPNTCHSMTRRQGGHLSFYARGCVRRRRSPWPPQCIPVLGLLFGFVQTIRRTNKRMNGWTNKRFVLALSQILSSPKYDVAHERGRLKIKFGSKKKQKIIPDFEGCHCGFITVNYGRTATILRPRMHSNHCTQQQTRTQYLRALISVYPGHTARILMVWQCVAPRLSPRPPRLSIYGREEDGKTKWRLLGYNSFRLYLQRLIRSIKNQEECSSWW